MDLGQDIYFDCTCGMDGHTALAALAHLGADFRPLEGALRASGLACRLVVEQVLRDMGPGRCVTLAWDGDARPATSSEGLKSFVLHLPLSEVVLRHVLTALDVLAEAMSTVLGCPAEDVCLKSAEADMVVLALGICLGLEQLGVRRVTASALPWPSLASGRDLPVGQAAVTAQLLLGKPVVSGQAGPVTPLAAALLDVVVDEYAPGPQGVPVALGLGYGSVGQGGAVRALLLRQTSPEAADHACGGREPVTQIETHLDHLNGEDLGLALTALMALSEVLDVLWLPGVGKKNRPAGLLRVLCLPVHQDVVARAVLRHTHTLGLRLQTLERVVLPRAAARMRVMGEELASKRYVLEGRTYTRPEADSLAATAYRLGLGVPALRYALRDKDGG